MSKTTIPTKNVIEEKNNKTLTEIKNRINKNVKEIEERFFQIGIDLIKVNLIVKNFRKWVEENTEIEVSTAYTLMRLVKRDKELADSKKYQTVKGSVSMFKLIRLLKYPSEFVDSLDFERLYEVPGGKKFNLIDMPREMFTEIVANEFKKKEAKEKGESTENLPDVPMDQMIVTQAKEKLDKLLSDLKTIFTALSEVTLSKDMNLQKTIEELESITKEADHISDATNKILGTLRTKATA